MFGFVQWDSPIALLLEVALALVVFVIAFRLARYVEKQQRGGGSGSLPLQSSGDESHDVEKTESKER